MFLSHLCFIFWEICLVLYHIFKLGYLFSWFSFMNSLAYTIMLRYVWDIFCIPRFSRNCLMKGWWILPKAPFASNEMLMWFCPLVYLYSGLRFLISSWNLIVVDNIFNVFPHLLCKCFIENICILSCQRSFVVFCVVVWSLVLVLG